jgi:hypothetical protein
MVPTMRASVRPAAALLWGLTVAVAAAAAVFLVLGPGRPLPEDLFGGVSGAVGLVLGLAYATVGALIVSRLPGHAVGWLFVALGLLSALNQFCYSFATWGLYARGGDVPCWRWRCSTGGRSRRR